MSEPQPIVQQTWLTLRQETEKLQIDEPVLADFLQQTILSHPTLASALSVLLAEKLATKSMPVTAVCDIIQGCYQTDPMVILYAVQDINAIYQRDPAVIDHVTPLLYLKGFHALQAYRVTHWLWQTGRHALAIYLQNQISLAFAVDIHPAAQIGHSILLDHATGIVIGETAVVENEVSILQSVTLGGTGKESGDRHPKIRQGVMIGAGAKVLGNIEVGRGAKIGAGSVVLQSVPAHTTVAGVPAKIVGKVNCAKPALNMDQQFPS